jgi:hypothetical protein
LRFLEWKKTKIPKALAKPAIDLNCHSEQSEESRTFKQLRSFTSFRMTEKNRFARASQVFEKKSPLKARKLDKMMGKRRSGHFTPK